MHHGVSGCALTFDDGPDPLWTPLVLDCLRRENVRATFFVIADRARRNGDLIERMRNEGHEVAFHCVRHIRHSELNEWGVVTPATTHVATLLGLAVVGWNLDTEDWRGDSAVDMHARVLDGIRTDAVVLMHDGLGPGARRSGCEQTVQLIPRLTETMRARRLLPLPLSELSR